MTNRIDSIHLTNQVMPQWQPQGREGPIEVKPSSPDGDRSQPKSDAAVTAGQPSVSSLNQAVDGLNEALRVLSTHMRFRLHEDTHRYYVEIVNTFEDEVIREVPPKRFLDMLAEMYRFMGLVVDEKR